MSNFGVKDTIDSLHQTIYDYLTTEYFGKNDALRECCKGELEKEGTLFRQAYIEANNAYKSIPQGISSCRIWIFLTISDGFSQISVNVS